MNIDSFIMYYISFSLLFNYIIVMFVCFLNIRNTFFYGSGVQMSETKLSTDSLVSREEMSLDRIFLPVAVARFLGSTGSNHISVPCLC